MDLFIRVPFQFHGEHAVLQPFRCIEFIIHITISVLPGNHFHVSQVKHFRVKCLAQRRNIETLCQNWEGSKMMFLWKSCRKYKSSTLRQHYAIIGTIPRFPWALNVNPSIIFDLRTQCPLQTQNRPAWAQEWKHRPRQHAYRREMRLLFPSISHVKPSQTRKKLNQSEKCRVHLGFRVLHIAWKKNWCKNPWKNNLFFFFF